MLKLKSKCYKRKGMLRSEELPVRLDAGDGNLLVDGINGLTRNSFEAVMVLPFRDGIQNQAAAPAEPHRSITCFE